MASIHPTPDGTFVVKWRENGKQKSKRRKTEKAALEFKELVEKLSSEDRAVLTRKDVPTLEDFCLDRMAEWTHLAPKTLKNYANLLTCHVFPELGHLAVHPADMRPRRFDEWQNDRLEDGAGPAALGKAQVLLGRILKRAVLPYEYLEVDPTAALEKPQYERRPARWLTAVEVERLREWYLARGDLESAALVSMLAYVGIRPQDALARDWTDLEEKLAVDTKNCNGKIVSGSKTDREHKRTVYVPGLVRGDLEALRLASGGTGLIFSRDKDGLPWTGTDWENWRERNYRQAEGLADQRPPCFKLAAEELGLGSTLTPYHLRHTAATLFAAAGWTHIQIANQLGHSPEVSTRVYQHLLDERPGGPQRSVEDYIREARGIAPKAAEASREGVGVR